MSEKDTGLVHVKTSTELVMDLAKASGNNALVAVLDRLTQLEKVNSSVADVIISARDLERNYTVPGPERFRRVVKLRKALDRLEARVRSGQVK